MAARPSEIAAYHRNAAVVTDRRVRHPAEKAAEVAAVRFFRRRKARVALEAAWARDERTVVFEATELVKVLWGCLDDLADALSALEAADRPELLGKIEAERLRVARARTHLNLAGEALAAYDFGDAGVEVDAAYREIAAFGGPLVVTVNDVLAQSAVGRELRTALQENLDARRDAREALERRRKAGATSAARATADLYALEAESLRLAGRIAGAQRVAGKRPVKGREKGLRVLQPQECETFADVGGLDDVKAMLRATVGTILERPDQAARYQVVHNGILFHGPPGTGKTLLSRALAGEYGLRYIRFSPASIASSYVHEAAANLHRLFEQARQNVPCVLFLDEVDTIASDRGDQPSADHREVVTQLMNSLEEYRDVPGLLIVAATNDLDRLDPGLREGRFDSKLMVPMPDTDARRDILRVVLERRADAVDWDDLDLDEVARKTGARNAAALETFATAAAQLALAEGRLIGQADLLSALKQREGNDRTRLDDRLTWDDVVLTPDVRERLDELLTVFTEPDLARRLGVTMPAGLLLYGPPGTGKTTIAKVVASQVSASFYEMSAADLLSKWVGESEQRVAKLFAKARQNRPAVIFVDEIEGLLRRRSGDSSAPWEQRVVAQFLRELDGLRGGEGVLLLGATNRLDIVDDAVVGRRLTPIEIGLPDLGRRLALLNVLCRDVALAKDVDLRRLAGETDGMSGADLKRLRDAAGMKALARSARSKARIKPAPTVRMADFGAAMASLRPDPELLNA